MLLLYAPILAAPRCRYLAYNFLVGLLVGFLGVIFYSDDQGVLVPARTCQNLQPACGDVARHFLPAQDQGRRRFRRGVSTSKAVRLPRPCRKGTSERFHFNMTQCARIASAVPPQWSPLSWKYLTGVPAVGFIYSAPNSYLTTALVDRRRRMAGRTQGDVDHVALD